MGRIMDPGSAGRTDRNRRGITTTSYQYLASIARTARPKSASALGLGRPGQSRAGAEGCVRTGHHLRRQQR